MLRPGDFNELFREPTEVLGLVVGGLEFLRPPSCFENKPILSRFHCTITKKRSAASRLVKEAFQRGSARRLSEAIARLC